MFFCKEIIAKNKSAQFINMHVIFSSSKRVFAGHVVIPDTAGNLPLTDSSSPDLQGEKKKGSKESKAGVDRQERGGLSGSR